MDLADIHVGLVSNSVDDVSIQQFPTQILGDGLCNAATAAAELPVDCQQSVTHDAPC